MGFPVVTTCPPFSPCTKSDFFSAIAISQILVVILRRHVFCRRRVYPSLP
jgi:hypothetical protein